MKRELLSLPLEIRRLIIHEAICTPSDPPKCPSATQDGRRQLSQMSVWQLPVHQNPALSLLLVNRQLHDEVRDVLRFAPPRYHVDIMFVKSHGLWTTWSMPPLNPTTRHIDTVSCAFRLFEPTGDLDKRFARSFLWQYGCGGPPTGVWRFYDLLKRLVSHGPGFCAPRDHRYTFGTILVDVLTPTDGAPHTSILVAEKDLEDRKGRRNHRNHRMNFDGIPREQALAKFITGQLEMILRLGYHTTRYGTFLYECVSHRIVISVNGKEYKSFDMDEHLEKQLLPETYWGETPICIVKRKERAARWKAWVLDRRRRMREGLEVEDDSPGSWIM